MNRGWVCLFALWCARCGLAAPVSQQSPPAPSAADIALEGVTLRDYRGSELHLTATMPHLELKRESTDLRATDVTARLESGTAITATTVTGNANEGRIEGSSSVTLRSPSGMTGRAPSATYERALGPKGGAHGREGLHLDHPAFSLDAKTFAVDFATEQADFTESVTKTKISKP